MVACTHEELPQPPNGEHPIIAVVAIISIIAALPLITWARAEVHGPRDHQAAFIDPERIREANENARKAGVTKLVEFRQEDLFKADFRDATIITLYLLPDLNVKLRPKLWDELKPGTRIVSHQFEMGTWKPEKKLESNGRTIYFWTVPPKDKRPKL